MKGLNEIKASLGWRVVYAWVGDDPCGDGDLPPWSGVTCSTQGDYRVVTELEVYAVSIVGPFPIAVTNLLDLTRLKSMKKGQVKFCKVAPSVALESPKFQTGSKTNILQEALSTIGKQHIDDRQLENQSSSQPQSPPKKVKGGLSGDMLISNNPDITDIDADHKDPQLCGVYAPDIYSNLRVAELVRRPCPNFIETIQRDITQSMQRILVDWLVEVSIVSLPEVNMLLLSAHP
uniref:Uncharacterized protein n=1 Tax=Fagus sylvatica TaxID=28930 RepID=A0A2N9F4Z5_FAGSY